MAVESRNNLFAADDDCFSEKCIYPDTDIIDMETQHFIGGHDAHFGDKYILADIESPPFLHYYRLEIWAISAVMHVILAIKVVPYLRRIRTLSNKLFWGLSASLVMSMMCSVINIVNSYTLVHISAGEAHYSPIINLAMFAGTCLVIVQSDGIAAPFYEDGIKEDQE